MDVSPSEHPMNVGFPLIPTVRGQTEIRTFLSALGFARETRLTAVLGYEAIEIPQCLSNLRP